MASNEEMELKAGGWFIFGMLVVRYGVGISTLHLTVVKVLGRPVIALLLDGVQEITFCFSSSSSKRNDQSLVER
jgi:hypothetical protein